MYDKKHKNSVLNLISKLGKLNPMLDKQHSKYNNQIKNKW